MSLAIPFGNYELIERIAEGGMAEVWRARSRGVAGFEKTVVIKRVLPTLLARPGFADLLVREAKIAARLSHPNIVQIYDLGEFEASYFIAMEYLEGRDLAAALSYRAGEPLSLPLRLFVAAEVAKALDYAHRVKGDDGKALSIVHRDISPQNVLLGFEGEVKVADFGIARADSVDLGQGEDPSILRGKYAYMSPEQARGEPLDRRSDLFSFGILLYELATRRRMYRSKTPQEVLEMVRHGKLPAYERRVPLAELTPILGRALALDREDRFESAAEIHDALNRLIFQLGKPVGQVDLAREMHRMFPITPHDDPNKLRVDIMVRAMDDAKDAEEQPDSATQPASAVTTARTVALPHAGRKKADRRLLTFLVLRPRHGDRRLFQGALGPSGGAMIEGRDPNLLAVFGLLWRERAAAHAARCALEIRRASRLEGVTRVDRYPAMALVSVWTVVTEDGAVAMDEAAFRRIESFVPEEGEIRVDPELAPRLLREFRFHEQDGQVTLDGYRSWRDREAGTIRRGAPLVGQRKLLRKLAGMLVDASRGRGRMVHVVGEPGVGKSRLLAELRAAAAPKDFLFVHGRAVEAEAGQSLAALADLVEDLAGIESEDAPQQRFDKIARLRVLGLSERAVRVMGELIGLAYPMPSDRRPGRPRGLTVALSLRGAIRRLSQDRVVVLALEDLQWMDDATRQVLPLLVSGLPKSRVLVLITRRPGTRGALRAEETVEILPLDRDATGRLLAHHLGARKVDPALAARVRYDTGGIPAWIEVMAEPLRPLVVTEDDVVKLGPDAPEHIPLPASVRGLVAARIERLRVRDRSMLRVAAAMGGKVSVRELSSVEGLIGHSERPPLRRLLSRRLLAPADPESSNAAGMGAWGGDEGDERLPTEVVLPSELLRRAVMAEMDEGERARLHSRIVATLSRLGVGETTAGLRRLAEHASKSIDRRRASEYFVAAAEGLQAEGDHASAADALIRAAALIREEREPSDPESFELSLRAADEALRAGALDLAEAALTPLGLATDRVGPELAVRRALAEARRARRELRTDDAVAALGAVEDRLSEVSAALRNRALRVLGWSLLDNAETDRAIGVFSGAVGSSEGVEQGRALAARAVAFARADRLADADADLKRSLALAARLGEVGLRFASLVALAAVAEARGEPSSAKYREAAEIGIAADERLGVSRLYALAAIAALAEDDDDQAVLHAEDAARHAKKSKQPAWGWVAGAIQAAIAIRALPEVAFVPRLVRAVDELEAERPGEAALAVEMLAYAHLALDDAAAAGRTLERAAALAEKAGHRSLARRMAERAAAL